MRKNHCTHSVGLGLFMTLLLCLAGTNLGCNDELANPSETDNNSVRDELDDGPDVGAFPLPDASNTDTAADTGTGGIGILDVSRDPFDFDPQNPCVGSCALDAGDTEADAASAEGDTGGGEADTGGGGADTGGGEADTGGGADVEADTDTPDLGCTYDADYWADQEGWSMDDGVCTEDEGCLCDLSWRAILQPAEGNNAWAKLAVQWITAMLNVQEGADSSEIDELLAAAEALLDDCGVNGHDHAAALSIAQQLEDFNEGTTGPGACVP